MDLGLPNVGGWIAFVRCAATYIILMTYPRALWTPALAGMAGGIALYSLLMVVAPVRRRMIRIPPQILVGADALLASLLIYLTGGPQSPFLSILYLPVLEATVGVSFRFGAGTVLFTAGLLWASSLSHIATPTLHLSISQRILGYAVSSLCLAAAYGAMSGVARKYQLEISALEEDKDLLTELADHDPLTGACNRTAFLQRFENEIKRAERHESPLSLIMIDVDNLTRINHEQGHEAGDRALVKLTTHLYRNCRSADLVCRYGGDEFLILLPKTSSVGASIWMRRAREGLAVDVPEFSMGWACYPETADDTEAVLRTAEASLQTEKTSKAENLLLNRSPRRHSSTGASPVTLGRSSEK